MIDERAEHLPPPLTVYLISRNTPHVKQALYCFWSLQVMRVRWLNDEVLLPSFTFRDISLEACRRCKNLGVVHFRYIVEFEVGDLGGQTGGGGAVHAHASLGQLTREQHILLLLFTPCW